MPNEPDSDGSEAEMLVQYLDVQRGALLAKTEGLDQEQMLHVHPPSALTLAGLYHLSLAEEDWMEIHFLGQPDRDPFVGADWNADRTGSFVFLSSWGRSNCASATAKRATGAGPWSGRPRVSRSYR